MSYFETHYKHVSLPIDKGTEETKGLRKAQIGAVHAVAAHFTLKSDPAIVVMPTGSGKTAVLMISAFLLEAKRVLVVTPSQLVRNEIATQFTDLSVLKRLNVVRQDIQLPSVWEQRIKIVTSEDWERLKDYDVVVATPNSVSPGIEEIPEPPADLFDLILVDEAHHSPARTWNQLFSSFPNAKRLLVTATPFRRDSKEIQGRFIYIYPLREAYKDQIFGQIEFIPVELNGHSSDLAIAKKAEEIFNADKARGLHHALMVRTDSKSKADELKVIYAQQTQLKLRVVHSGHSFGHIKRTISQLRSQEIDGVICVNMMGEGFDFPNLKIAAIHTPHKSLAITLQFIGRFARTNAGNIDVAKFLAVPSEITVESTKLYDEGTAWQEIITNLSRLKIDEEVHVQEFLQDFNPREIKSGGETEDVSMYTLRPYGHVKIYRLTGNVNINITPELPPNFEITNFWDHSDQNASVLIAREIKKPKWARTDQFSSIHYHLFVFYYDQDTNLLFINSTLKQAEVYEDLARSFTDGTPKILPINRMNKVLLSLTNPIFYNVGMKNRLQSATAESYRNITGPSAQKAISQSDGQLYHRGHVFGGDEDSTIGFSSSSKVWSNMRVAIPNLIKWCKSLAQNLSSNSDVITNSPLDYLQVGQEINRFPIGVIGALWSLPVFKDPPEAKYLSGDNRYDINLLDLDLAVDARQSSHDNLRLVISNNHIQIELDYRLDTAHWFTAVDDAQLSLLEIIRSHKNVTILDYLNSNLPEFFFADFSRVHGAELFPWPGGTPPAINDDQLVPIDWVASNVDITKEFGPCATGKRSIHDYLEILLPRQADVVFYDHKNGEVADFITFSQGQAETTITFFHCKGSNSQQPGVRVNDYYEVCMQVVKSLNWIENHDRLLKHFDHRVANVGSKYIKGTRPVLKDLLDQSRFQKVVYKLIIVQPGIQKSDLGELGPLLASAGDYISKSRGQKFEVWCSS
jgi:superfamily II DNA or RNA helicase